MKKILFTLIALVCFSAAIEAQTRVLVAYFSRAGENSRVGNIQIGNTAVVAGQIAALTGGDIFEIVPETEYPRGYQKCLEFAREEKDLNMRPGMRTNVDNLKQYDIIYLGYPIWWNTVPMIINTFIETNNHLRGKIIIPFCTYEATKFGISIDDIKRNCPDADVKDGLCIKGTEAKTSKTKIIQFITKQKYKSNIKRRLAKEEARELKAKSKLATARQKADQKAQKRAAKAAEAKKKKAAQDAVKAEQNRQKAEANRVKAQQKREQDAKNKADAETKAKEKALAREKAAQEKEQAEEEKALKKMKAEQEKAARIAKENIEKGLKSSEADDATKKAEQKKAAEEAAAKKKEAEKAAAEQAAAQKAAEKAQKEQEKAQKEQEKAAEKAKKEAEKAAKKQK